jgi:hypothetical protein
VTEAQWAALEAYVADLAQRIGVAHWQITVKHEPCGADAYAEISQSIDHHEADLSVCQEFAQRTPTERRYSIVHELIHLHLAEMVGHTNHLQTALGNQVFEVFRRVYGTANETATHALARVIAPYIPLCYLPSAESKADEPAPAG